MAQELHFQNYQLHLQLPSPPQSSQLQFYCISHSHHPRYFPNEEKKVFCWFWCWGRIKFTQCFTMTLNQRHSHPIIAVLQLYKLICLITTSIKICMYLHTSVWEEGRVEERDKEITKILKGVVLLHYPILLTENNWPWEKLNNFVKPTLNLDSLTTHRLLTSFHVATPTASCSLFFHCYPKTT